MIIAIPTEDKNMDKNVYPSFGRAPFFLLYNTDTQESQYLDNSAVMSQGGAGIRAAQVIADNRAKALIAPRCGENAEKVLTGAQVLIYKAIDASIKDNIDALINEKLALLTDIHPGFHGNEQK
jgi:predicted Fe-Mo cluster-binding NifX family protein